MKSVNGMFGTLSDRSVNKRGRAAVRFSSRSNMTLEMLEPRQLLAGVPVIMEFMAKNDGFFEDGDGNAPDWIEIQNIGDEAIDLAGYRLTDSAANLEKWTFPSVPVTPGDYFVVFASGQDVDNYVDGGGYLHTTFGLKADGEYLALVAPDGTVMSEFGSKDANYPAQIANVSYGLAQQQLLVHESSDASYFPVAAADVENWTSLNFDALANGFVMGKAAMGIETQPDSRNSFSEVILTELASSPHAVYSRMEFDLDDVSHVSQLNLRMKYDNGFIAYLNGVRVASENAPDDAGWFSVAPNRAPSDRQALQFVDFDLSEHVRHLVNGKNVLAIHGMNNLSDKADMLLVPQLLATVNSPNAKAGYMASPTPGAQNVGDSGVFLGTLGDIEINGEPGFYDEPFTVTVSAETPDVEIRYTTDGAPPTATTGTVYTGDPIQIDSTTTLRARAFKDEHIPSDVETQSYLFLEEIIRQPQAPPGLPTEWRDGISYPADYEMDPDIVDDPAYRDQIIDSLKSLRTMSIVMDPEKLFGLEGMHNNTDRHGRESEHPISLEILNPDGSLAHQVDAGIRIHGACSRHYRVAMKQSFRLTFRGEYGATRLEYPLFPDSPADAFDNVILNAGKIRDDAQLVGNSFGRNTNLAMGNLDAHSTYVHLYLNGLYWGVFNPMERTDGQFGETYLGGSDSDYDSIHTFEAVDGSFTRFNQLISANTIARLDTKEEYEDYLKQVDVDSLIDLLLINQYMAHNDHEFRALGKKEGDADFRFMIWDVDEMANTNAQAREDIDTYFSSGVYRAITRHPEMRLRYADRIQKHLFNGGALTPEAVQARWEGLAQEVRASVIAESARWGDMRWNDSVPRTVYTLEDFDKFGQNLAERYIPVRTDNLFNELKNNWRVYPDTEAPQWNHVGGPISADFQLTMANPNAKGVILYTLDGTDPRQYGGDVATSAIIHDGSPISITADTVVNARALVDGQWSALMEGEFVVVGPDSPFHLRVTEINFNPHDANVVAGLGEADVDNSQFEFIEITNTSSGAIDTSGIQLSRGVQFTFPENSSLAAGGQVLIVNNQEAFESRYGMGLNIAGEFENDSLPDVQALVDLRDAAGRQLQSFTYKGQAWSRKANGRGSTLEVVDPSASSSSQANWRSSSQFGGSPGAAGSGPGSQLTVSEVLAHSEMPGGDKVEIHNASGTAIDISNWYVSNSDDDYFMHQIAAGTTMPANGFHVLSQSELGFDLSGSRGDDVLLIAADANGTPTRFADHIQFGPSAEGVSMGPGPDDQTWLPLARQTFGSTNSGLYVGEAIISEVNYAPLDPDGDRRTLRARDFEFVELFNTTDSVVDISNWQLSGDFSMTLPAGTTIDAGRSLLVVPFNPQDMGKESVFRFFLGVEPDVPMVGPYSDLLGDEGGIVRLDRPDQPPADDPTLIPLLYVDEVAYAVVAPWPVDAISNGNSLTRLTPAGYGNSPGSWTSAAASPGTVDFVLRVTGDSNEDGRFDQLDLVQVLQGGKYQTGQPASFGEGDWNGDAVFSQLDIVAALQIENYLAP